MRRHQRGIEFLVRAIRAAFVLSTSSPATAAENCRRAGRRHVITLLPRVPSIVRRTRRVRMLIVPGDTFLGSHGEFESPHYHRWRQVWRWDHFLVHPFKSRMKTVRRAWVLIASFHDYTTPNVHFKAEEIFVKRKAYKSTPSIFSYDLDIWLQERHINIDTKKKIVIVRFWFDHFLDTKMSKERESKNLHDLVWRKRKLEVR